MKFWCPVGAVAWVLSSNFDSTCRRCFRDKQEVERISSVKRYIAIKIGALRLKYRPDLESSLGAKTWQR
jgi:hypothetical protein